MLKSVLQFFDQCGEPMLQAVSVLEVPAVGLLRAQGAHAPHPRGLLPRRSGMHRAQAMPRRRENSPVQADTAEPGSGSMLARRVAALAHGRAGTGLLCLSTAPRLLRHLLARTAAIRLPLLDRTAARLVGALVHPISHGLPRLSVVSSTTKVGRAAPASGCMIMTTFHAVGFHADRLSPSGTAKWARRRISVTPCAGRQLLAWTASESRGEFSEPARGNLDEIGFDRFVPAGQDQQAKSQHEPAQNILAVKACLQQVALGCEKEPA